MPQAVLQHALVWAQLLSQPLGTVQPLQDHPFALGTGSPSKLLTVFWWGSLFAEWLLSPNLHRSCKLCLSTFGAFITPVTKLSVSAVNISLKVSATMQKELALNVTRSQYHCVDAEKMLQGARHSGSAAVLILMSSTLTPEQHCGQQVMCGTSQSLAPSSCPLSLPNAHKCLIKLNNSARHLQITSQGFLCILSWKTFYIDHNMAVTMQHYKSSQGKVFPWGISVRETEAAISLHLQKEIELLTFCTTSMGNSNHGQQNSHSSAMVSASVLHWAQHLRETGANRQIYSYSSVSL